MSGRWIHRSSQSAHFFVPNFVDPGELDEIRPYLPATDISSTLRDKLQDFPPSVPRDLGKPLIRKMLDFWAESDVAYQATSSSLDKAHEHVANHTMFKYATLEQIAEKVLPNAASKTKGRDFPDYVLYAVHRSLLRDDIGFRPQTKGTLRTGGQYEISPVREISTVQLVRQWVRLHREQEAAKASGTTNLPPSQLEQFAIAARRLVDLSRKTRPLTKYGTIRPLENWQKANDSISSSKSLNTFAHFISFLESWSALSTFGYQSSLNGIGSEILRAIQRYEEVDLDPTTAWTFLQEIGVIAPWENRLAFDLRLPGVGRRLSGDSFGPPLAFPIDRLEHLRKDWGDLPVYCVDDPGAHEIDDGISIEATDIPDEYWVHIHSADPAAHINPDGEVAAYAETAIENVYMPERVYSILPVSVVQAHWSLAPHRPSMTFSARMNKQGQLLDTKITTGKVHKVLFFSPAVLNEAVLGPPTSKAEETVRVVGLDVPESSPSRRMLESHELSVANKADLQLLHEIANAHAALLRAKGGVDQSFPSKPKTSVSIPVEMQENHYGGDPRIQLSTVEVTTRQNKAPNQDNLVQSFMLVAAQVAAKWCNDRGVPVPYRVTPRNPAKEDPFEFFHRKVLPSRAANGVASIDVTSEYLRLIGGVLPSTTPGPHAAVGVDMMVRCTSPLRRFTDLLVHWQIGATLLEEDRLGHSLIGNTKDDFLPFSKARVETLLPRLDAREKLIKYGKSEADRHWLCFFLLRAWQFKEAELPATLPFLVRNVNLEYRKVYGTLTDFSARAQCSVPDEMDLEEIKVGDTVKVELEHVNVYDRKIQVKVV